MTKWKIRSHGGRCDHCGGSEDVVQYVHKDTGETQRICDPCEQAAAGVK